MEICSPIQRSSRIATIGMPSDRIEATSKLALSIGLRIVVVSDYLFIGSGTLRFLNIESMLETVRRVISSIIGANTSSSMRHLQQAVRRLTGLGVVKEFYKVRVEGRYVPAVPGSSIKGAVRSRIELGSSGSEVVAPLLYDTGALSTLPTSGSHGWRHARIWCESVFETRHREDDQYSPLEDLFGIAGTLPPLSSRIYFGTLLGKDVRLEVLTLDHNERVEAAPRGSVFEGEVRIFSLNPAELGLLFYGLAQDKKLCGREPLMLLGAYKYRCRKVIEPRQISVEFGIVRVEITKIEPAPWSRRMFEEFFGSRDIDEIVSLCLDQAFKTYSGLRKCFDEVERRRCVEPCR